MPNICAIDFGTENFAAIVCNDSSSKLYKGGAIFSEYQWFCKERAKAVGIITKGHRQKSASSKYLDLLSRNYYNFIFDQCHRISKSIVFYCQKHQAGTLTALVGTDSYYYSLKNASVTTTSRYHFHRGFYPHGSSVIHAAITANNIKICYFSDTKTMHYLKFFTFHFRQ